jgi:Predicted transcriptional regulator with C-terminal CBS domains
MKKVTFNANANFDQQAIAVLKKVRKVKKLTQKQLAELLGVSQPRIAHMESGKSSMTLETLQKIINL